MDGSALRNAPSLFQVSTFSQAAKMGKIAGNLFPLSDIQLNITKKATPNRCSPFPLLQTLVIFSLSRWLSAGLLFLTPGSKLH